ncbi:hypothetical protein BH10PSE16_BH10PSE16_43240 [soil metagenome]
MTTTTAQAVRNLCTPEQHAKADKTKPVTLVALGTGPHGKTALLTFPGGWQRTIDLATPFDGWHPLFADLPQDDRQRLRDHAAPAFVSHPDGTQSRPDPLSFIRRIRNARGTLLHWNCFDVPKETHADGAATGYRCAAELLELLALGYGPHISMWRVLEEVAEAAKEDFYGTNRRAAAVAFLEVVEGALVFFAKRSSHQPWLADKIDRAERYALQAAERKAVERAEFVQRMKAGKAAKRRAQEAAIKEAA